MKKRISALACALVLPFAACDSLSVDGGERETVSLSFATTAGTGFAALLAVPPIGDGTDTLELSALYLTLDEVVLERSEIEADGDSDGESDGLSGDSDSENDSDSDGSGNEQFDGDSVTIEIPLDGDVVTELSVPVPTGLYEELELDVASVRLVGTYNGEAFDVTVPVDLELETEFEPPIDVFDELNLTVSLDLAAWLREGDGNVVDPRLLLTDDAALARLVQRIAVSLDAFEDSDHDGDHEDSDSDD